MGIDLGTSNTLVYVKGQGIVLREPSIVALEATSREIIAIGTEAKKMLGKTPGNIQAVRPLKDGVIADFDVTQEMIKHFIRKVHNRRSLLHPRVVIGIPSGITEVERRAVKDAAYQAGCREVYLIDEPLAAAIGANLNIEDAYASMIVDIGGGTTEIAVLCLGGVVVSKSLDIAGDELDDAIIAYFRKKHNLIIGEATAEEVKIKIGSAYPVEPMETEIRGRDQITGLPKTIKTDSDEIRNAIIETVNQIIQAIKDVLEVTPPELAADLVERGIMLSGGGALLRGIDKLIARETELPVRIADDPLTSVALGCGKYLENIDKKVKL